MLMTDQATRAPLDDFAASRAMLVLAFAWGLSEATFFFIVPDVLLTLIACRALKPAIRATAAALGGTLIGGALMYAFASGESYSARAFLEHVPAISPGLITRVAGQISESGLLAVLMGPLKGIPYKIYAVEWGVQNRNLAALLLISIPARCVRFFLASVAARGIARLIEPLTNHRAPIEMSILAVIWVAFYNFYFARFGW